MRILQTVRVHLHRLFSLSDKRKHNIISVKPNYQIVNKLCENSIVVDLGTGEDADFSQDLIRKFGLKAFGFDPTRKHHVKLDTVVERTNGRFKYYKYAIAANSQKKIFFESFENISGSLFKDHINVKNDEIRSYEVKTIRIDEIFGILKTDHIDLLKMDIEGGEYEVLASLNNVTLKKLDQIVVEFHHDTVDRFCLTDTQRAIRSLEDAGFKSYSEDYINYLFFRAKQTPP